MTDNIKPIGTRVLLQKLEEKPTGSIIIPQNVIDKNRTHITAKVLAVGSRVKTNIKPGDIVVGYKYMDVSSSRGGKPASLANDIFITDESEILAVLEDYDG